MSFPRTASELLAVNQNYGSDYNRIADKIRSGSPYVTVGSGAGCDYAVADLQDALDVGGIIYALVDTDWDIPTTLSMHKHGTSLRQVGGASLVFSGDGPIIKTAVQAGTTLNWKNSLYDVQLSASGNNDCTYGIHLEDVTNFVGHNVQINSIPAGTGLYFTKNANSVPCYVDFFHLMIGAALNGVNFANASTAQVNFYGGQWNGTATTGNTFGLKKGDDDQNIAVYSATINNFQYDVWDNTSEWAMSKFSLHNIQCENSPTGIYIPNIGVYGGYIEGTTFQTVTTHYNINAYSQCEVYDKRGEAPYWNNHGYDYKVLNGQTALTFAHNLVAAPKFVNVGWKTSLGTRDWYWSADATNITITLSSAAPAGDITFSWMASVKGYAPEMPTLSSSWENSGGSDVTDGGLWTGSTTGVSVSSTHPNSGTYGLMGSFVANTGPNFQNVYKTLTSANTYYCRFYVYFTSLGSNNQRMSLCEIYRNGAVDGVQVGVILSSGSYRWFIGYFDSSWHYVNDATTTVSLNTPYCVELTWTRGTSGTYQYWINGVSFGSGTFNNNQQPNRAILGIADVGGTSTTTCTVYIDDAVIDTSYIGLLSSGIQKFCLLNCMEY